VPDEAAKYRLLSRVEARNLIQEVMKNADEYLFTGKAIDELTKVEKIL